MRLAQAVPTHDDPCFTDKQLRKRWHCSAMKLWRMRQRGVLRSFKAGGTGQNLTHASDVLAAEADEQEAS